jgi:hypothetical protein
MMVDVIKEQIYVFNYNYLKEGGTFLPSERFPIGTYETETSNRLP